MENLRKKIRISPFLRQVFVVSGAAVNILGHGCIHGFPAVLFSQLQKPGRINTTIFLGDQTERAESLEGDSGGEKEFRITDLDASWIASLLGVMGLLGNFLSPVLMNRFGRQKTHLLSTIPALLGWGAILLANSVPMLLTARLLHGLAIGIRTPLAAILVAEYTNPEYRGAFLGTFAISLALGILITHLIGVFLTWKFTALVSAVFPLLAMVIISVSPESPSWLAAKGRYDTCKESFHWLRGNGDEQKKELNILIASQKVKFKSESRFRYSVSAFGRQEFLKPAVIAVCMFFIFEFGGAHVVPAYANRILTDILGKNSGESVHWQITTIDALRLVTALFAIVLLKKFNRRIILFTSGVSTVLSFVSISIYMFLRTNGIYLEILDSFLPLTLVVIYVVSFCLGLVPLTWVLCGEIFPLAYRSLGSTFSTACLTPAFMLSMKTAPHLFNTVSVEGAYLVYATILSFCLAIIYCLLPETRGKTLEEIEKSFKGEKSICDVEMSTVMLNK